MNEVPLPARRLQLQEFNQLWVVEYSVGQNAFSVKTVNETVETNRATISRGTSVDYVPVAFTSSHKEAVTLSDKLRTNIDERNARLARSESESIQLLDQSEDSLWSFLRT